MEVPSSRRKTHRQGGAKDGTALGMPSQWIMSLLIAADLPQGTPFPRPVLMPGNRTLCPCNIPFLGRGDALEKPKQQNSTSKIPAYCLIPNERRKKKYLSLLREVLSGMTRNWQFIHPLPNGNSLLNVMVGVQSHGGNAKFN